MAPRRLIVNADDFGQSPGVNRGIIAAHERGVVTSTSLMVRWPAAAEAAAYARAHPQLAVGLHLDLAEWAYRGDGWVRLYEVVPVNDPDAVAAEVDRQLEAFRHLVGRDPTHLDSHQHVHREEPVRALVLERARGMKMPLRHFTPGVHYCGDFYGQAGKGYKVPECITVENLVRIVRGLSPGVTELGCHPGEVPDDLDSMYRAERAAELQTLCDDRVRTALAEEGVRLCSFAEVADLAQGM